MNEVFLKSFLNKAGEIYGRDPIPLHRPIFEGREREYLVECIDSNFVSSVGARVTEFEREIASFTGAAHAVATVNGTAALHVALKLAGVNEGDEVISQALTFIATCNAISYAGATPVFVDVDFDTMGLSPSALNKFLETSAKRTRNGAVNKSSGKRIAACVPMHTFGFPCRMREIIDVCDHWNIPVIEDAAESLGSYIDGTHTGCFASMATFSFNGNKVITTGGGGMLITNDADLARRAKHLTTTSKVPHAYEFFHDEVGYNYRMPNLNAALGCAQMERLDEFLSVKKHIANEWAMFFDKSGVRFFTAMEGTIANHWLNATIFESKADRDQFLTYTNDNDVMTRPIWTLMSKLPMFQHCENDGLQNSRWLEERVVNIPSSVPSGVLSEFSA